MAVKGSVRRGALSTRTVDFEGPTAGRLDRARGAERAATRCERLAHVGCPRYDPPGQEARMRSTVTEIAPRIYRISTFAPDFGIQFNQFLGADDAPFLMHT